MLLPAALSRPSSVYLCLFVCQLLCALVWLSSLRLEQHLEDGPSGFAPPGSTATTSSVVPSRMLDALVAAKCAGASEAAKLTSADCGERVAHAIHQLEALKTEVHVRRASTPTTNTNAIDEPTTSTPAAAGAVGSPARLPFLIIGIPSMPRAADYLSPVLRAIDQQLARDPLDPMYAMIHVWVMSNVAPLAGSTGNAPLPQHASFDANRAIYRDRPEYHFLQNDHAIVEPPLPVGGDHEFPDKPSASVRKQTRDIVSLMRAAHGRSTYYLAMEDDFELCPNTLRILEHALRKGSYPTPGQTPTPLANWISMKFSYGFNGFLVRNNEDLRQLGEYLLMKQRLRPPDHTLVEWSCAEKPEAKAYVGDRPHLTYRYNLFTHLGKISSLRATEQSEYAGCYRRMDTVVVFPVDAFQFDRCDHDDLSPCLPKDHPQWTPPYGIEQRRVEQENQRK